jgi:hypothetical protein
MTQGFTHNLGDRVKDIITGQVGIVTSRSEHIFGCNRYWVEPQEIKDGKPIEGRWFDEEAIELVLAGAVKAPRYARVVVAEERQLSRAGGPTSQPPSHSGSGSR